LKHGVIDAGMQSLLIDTNFVQQMRQ